MEYKFLDEMSVGRTAGTDSTGGGNVMKKNNIGKKDYNKIKLSFGENIFIACKGFFVIGVISYLFYRSITAFIFLIPIVIFIVKNEKRRFIIEKKKALQRQFKEGITLLLSGLEAGYSIENAFEDASNELRQMYQKETDIEREFRIICRGVKFNEPIDVMLFDFADRSGLEDIKNFAEVFVIARKRGGDLITILKSSINTIQEKLAVKEEIDTLLSGKRLEHNIMSVVPIGILFYINITSPEFLNPLYCNIVGVLVMSVCLSVYIVSIFIGKKIIEVEI